MHRPPPPLRILKTLLTHTPRRHFTTKLPTHPVRTRFAPSPTGHLHLGSLRTALFNYLLARKTRGQFLLRLEDTDASRTVPGAEESIYSALEWAGLHWDEGPHVGGPHGPYRQSERRALYRDAAARLIASGHGYRCFCSVERLDELRKMRGEMGLPTEYDGACAGMAVEEAAERAERGEMHVVRMRAPEVLPVFTDLVYGRVGGAPPHRAGELVFEAPVLIKRDGNPTYHFANVVDDHDMGITHVVRATEWLPSTRMHLALYEAFGWTPPGYAHVGLLVDVEGKKLSKRAMATGIEDLKRQGWLKEAVVNFAALLGCSYRRKGKTGDVMGLDELVEEFYMKFTRGDAVVTQEKLVFLQKAHAKRALDRGWEDETTKKILRDLKERAKDDFQATKSRSVSESLDARCAALFAADARNYVTPDQFYKRNHYFFTEIPMDEIIGAIKACCEGVEEVAVFEKVSHVLETFHRQLQNRPEWLGEEINKNVLQVTAESMPEDLVARILGDQNWTDLSKARSPALYKLLRAALVAGKEGLGIVDTIRVFGPDETEHRIASLREAWSKIQTA